MSFLAEDPLLRGQEQQSRQPNYIQSGPMAQSQPGIGNKLLSTAAGKATNMMMEGPMQAASTALLGTAPIAATTTAAGVAIPAVAGTGMVGSLAGMGALGAGAAPMLAAMGPFALAALPFLLNNGTSSVPSQDFGPDPLARVYNNGTKRVPGYNNGSRNVDEGRSRQVEELTPDQQLFREAQKKMDERNPNKGYITDDQLSPFFKFIRAYNPFQHIMDRREPTPDHHLSEEYLFRDEGTFERMGYNNGTMGVKPTTNMGYAGGTDSVPAMLTPGEAIIPAAAAQNPVNKPMIDSMVSEGRAANQMAQGGPMQAPQQAMPEMAGPLSGKTQREQIKLVQEMSLKKKAWEAEEQRKQMAFDQKMSQDKMKANLAMRQSQE